MASADLEIRPGVVIPGWTLTESFVLSSGPGGQNVNKVATAVQLRFHAQGAGVFTPAQLQRLFKLAGSRATKQGEIILEVSSTRSQERNRQLARERLAELVEKALEPPPPPRRKTRPSRGAIERRLKQKAVRSGVKKARERPTGEE